MRKLLIVSLLLSLSSSFAMEMHNAEVLEHKSEITGGDDKGYPIDGHIELGKDAISNSQEKFQETYLGKKNERSRVSPKT